MDLVKRPISRRRFVVGGLAASLSFRLASLHSLAAPPTKPPATKSAVRIAIDAAIETLRQEFAVSRREPKLQTLRTVCDYFDEKKPDGLTPEVLFDAVGQRVDADPQVAAYIRWQLLSGIPVGLDAAAFPRALSLYREAPDPSPRFGLSEREQQQLDGLLDDVKKTDDVILTSKLEALVRDWSARNRHVIAYRDEWYRRLAKSPAVFVAAFEDAFKRQNLAAGAEDFSPLVIADVQTWLAVGKADPAQCAMLAGVLAKLRDKPAPQYYASAGIRSGKLTWVKKTDSMDPRKKLTHLHQALVEAAQKKK